MVEHEAVAASEHNSHALATALLHDVDLGVLERVLLRRVLLGPEEVQSGAGELCNHRMPLPQARVAQQEAF